MRRTCDLLDQLVHLRFGEHVAHGRHDLRELLHADHTHAIVVTTRGINPSFAHDYVGERRRRHQLRTPTHAARAGVCVGKHGGHPGHKRECGSRRAAHVTGLKRSVDRSHYQRPQLVCPQRTTMVVRQWWCARGRRYDGGWMSGQTGWAVPTVRRRRSVPTGCETTHPAVHSDHSPRPTCAFGCLCMWPCGSEL